MILLRILVIGMAIAVQAVVAQAEWKHAIAMHGEPMYGPDFKHFSYVDPAAPKGGSLRISVLQSFDSTNPLIVKGVRAAGVRLWTLESLMARGHDEAFTLYGLLAEAVEVPDDRSWVAFRLNKQAKFSDGQPVTVDDVIFSLETLRDFGRPNYGTYYSKVTKIERPSRRVIKLHFSSDADREIPLILGLMPILPKHIFAGKPFDKTMLTPFPGSGPYVMEDIDPGKSLTYRRNLNYWGRDLPVNTGRFNFDKVQYLYFRDGSAAFEAFKKRLVDVREESDPTKWANDYVFPPVKDGRVVLSEVPSGLPAGMWGLAFNTRRAVFADQNVRKAIVHLLDFEWINAKLYNGLYRRTQSFYSRSELSSHLKPASAFEKELLKPYPGAVSPQIMAGTYAMPISDGRGRNRKNRRMAQKLFSAAGYEIKAGKLAHTRTGEPLSFEITVVSKAEERLALTFARSLQQAGVAAKVRLVDSSQFQARLASYDFDMIPYQWDASLSPGNEQTFYFGSQGRTQEGTRNYFGADEPAVDAMIAALLAAKEREAFVGAVRALDRVLLSGTYVVPLFHRSGAWLAVWSHIRRAPKSSLFGYRLETWWHQG
ncbi:MAG: ABC transporter substrate-binding protein [Alphaproteobacteria bacterium]|nr:ABC transporter substrate-binding protein [Alphaproteobacteria bacterium]